jgi:hypothetical protein
MSERQREAARQTGLKNKTHGLSKKREYGIWTKMIKRCYDPTDPAYRNYGGRGIRVCERWLNVENFIADIGKRPEWATSLDRIDNNLGYDKANMRWANKKMQNSNQRRVKLYTAHGKTMHLYDWAKETGVSYTTLRSRVLDGGVPLERALQKGIIQWNA